MKARDDNNGFLSDEVEKRVWESAKESAADILISYWKGFRVALNSGETCVRRTQELGPKPLSALFVPVECFLNLTRGFGADGDLVSQDLRTFIFNSSHGIPPSGFRA